MYHHPSIARPPRSLAPPELELLPSPSAGLLLEELLERSPSSSAAAKGRPTLLEEDGLPAGAATAERVAAVPAEPAVPRVRVVGVFAGVEARAELCEAV